MTERYYSDPALEALARAADEQQQQRSEVLRKSAEARRVIRKGAGHSLHSAAAELGIPEGTLEHLEANGPGGSLFGAKYVSWLQQYSDALADQLDGGAWRT